MNYSRLVALGIVILSFAITLTAQTGISVPSPICEGDSLVQFTTTDTAGFWGEDLDSLGIFDATTGSAGNPYLATYTFIDSTGQTVVDSAYFDVGEIPVVQIDSVAPICANSGVQQLLAAPLGGIWGSSDGSTNSDGEFSPFFGAPSSPYTAWYTYTDSVSTCAATDTVSIIVLDIPQVSLNAPGNVCPNDSAFQVQASIANGTWLNGTDSTGIFNPAIHPSGAYQVVYSVVDSNGCSNVASVTITIDDLAIPGGFTLDSLCLGSGSDTIQAIGLSGGIFYSGAAQFNGAINADTLGVGLHTVNYVTSCIGCCPYNDSLLITVLAPTPIGLMDSIFCADSDSLLLEPMGSVNSWGGVANNAGYIYPSVLGVGTFPVTMNGVDQNGCSSSDSLSIFMLPRPAVTLTSESPYCAGSEVDTIQVSPPGGIWTGPIDSANVFAYTDSVGNYPIAYSFVDSGFCLNEIFDTLIVLSKPIVNIDAVPGFCSTDPPYLMNATPAGGVWTGGSTSTGIFDPGSALISGTTDVEYTYTDTNGCSNADTASVVVLLEPEIIFGMNGPYCEGSGLLQLDVQPGLGVWSGAATPVGTFDGNNEPGNYVVSYTVNNGLCELTAFDTITVDDCTSIEEFTEVGFTMFPQPSTTELYIAFNNPVHVKALRLVSLQGKQVYQSSPGMVTRVKLNTEALAAGVYLLYLNEKRAGRISVVN